MANLQEFDFSIVLIVHDEVSLNDFIVVHLGQFTASLHVGESGGGIAYEPTSVLIAGIPHQGVKSGSEIIVSYSEPYAALIHYGGYILPYGNPNADKVYIPPRPWVESTLKGETGTYSVEEEVKRAILDLLK